MKKLHERTHTDSESTYRDDSKFPDGPRDYLAAGLKHYPAELLCKIENHAKSNLRTGRDTKTNEMKQYGYLMRLGEHNYKPQTVIEAIHDEFKVRANER